METMKSKVYVLTDERNRIIRCEGGYTTPADLAGWTEIDEGEGDRYNLCQTHYFEGGVYNERGIPLYQIVDGKPAPRTAAEIDADIAALPPAPPSYEEVKAENEELTRLIAETVDAQYNADMEVLSNV